MPWHMDSQVVHSDTPRSRPGTHIAAMMASACSMDKQMVLRKSTPYKRGLDAYKRHTSLECKNTSMVKASISKHFTRKCSPSIESGGFESWARHHVFRCASLVQNEADESIAMRWISSALIFSWKLVKSATVPLSTDCRTASVFLTALMWTALSHELSDVSVGKNKVSALHRLKRSLAFEMGCSVESAGKAQLSVLNALQFNSPRSILIDFLVDRFTKLQTDWPTGSCVCICAYKHT